MNIKAVAFYTGLTGATLLGGCAKKAEPLAKIVEKAQDDTCSVGEVRELYLDMYRW